VRRVAELGSLGGLVAFRLFIAFMDDFTQKILTRLMGLESRICVLEKEVSDWQCVALQALSELRSLEDYIYGLERLSDEEMEQADQLLATLTDGYIDRILASHADSDMKGASFAKERLDKLRKKKST
jgi:hypothetical protein